MILFETKRLLLQMNLDYLDISFQRNRMLSDSEIRILEKGLDYASI